MPATISKHNLYLVHLIACALHGRVPQPLPENTSWEDIFASAKRNAVATTCAFAVAKAPTANTAERKRWQTEVDQNLLRHVTFDMEREAIYSAMDNANLSYLPLKGIVISREYPRPEMRWMCDNDILFGALNASGVPTYATPADACKLQEIMHSLGYTTAHFGAGNHDSYKKAPILNMEMHHDLISRSVAFCSYYENPWQRARKNQRAGTGAYVFSHEDTYLFHIAHMYKHFSSAGCGVRGLADEWVLMHTWGATMNRAYLDAELEKLGLVDFEHKLWHLANACIENDACGRMLANEKDTIDPECVDMLAYLLGSGTYGTFTNRVKNQLAKEASTHGEKGLRTRYLLKRAFPSPRQLKECYPVLARAPWAIPGAYVFRLVTKPFMRRKQLATELSIVKRKGNNK